MDFLNDVTFTGSVSDTASGLQYKTEVILGYLKRENSACICSQSKASCRFNRNSKYTNQLNKIADNYDLDLNDTWNKIELPHQDRHLHAYHQWVLDEMTNIHNIAKGDKEILLSEFNNIKNTVIQNPEILRKAF